MATEWPAWRATSSMFWPSQASSDTNDPRRSYGTPDVAGTLVRVTRLEFELLVKFAGDPVRVFSKHELGRCIWGRQQISGRTVESHICRLRNRLTQAGADTVLVSKCGQGWSLTIPE
jgi:DNA-binding response OmpR family regulator